MEQVLSEYFSFLCPRVHRLLYTRYSTSSGADTIGSITVDSVPLQPKHSATILSVSIVRSHIPTALFAASVAFLMVMNYISELLPSDYKAVQDMQRN
jgi:hypothetical protein